MAFLHTCRTCAVASQPCAARDAINAALRGLDALPLVVTPGLNGYRLAFAGGANFDVIAEYPTFTEAWAAQKLLVGLADAFSGRAA